MKNFKITLNGTQIDSEDVFKYVRRWEIKDAIQYLINETGCTEEEANDVVDEIKDLMKYSLKQSVNKHTHNHQSTQSSKQIQSTQPQNIPHCPTCNSTNIEKISVGKKMKGSFLFGIFSSDVRNQMHCKDCGYKWQKENIIHFP